MRDGVFKIKAGCGIWKMLVAGYGMKLFWRYRDAFLFVGGMWDVFEIKGGDAGSIRSKMASKHDLSTIFIVIIRLIDELCFSDDHVSTNTHPSLREIWLAAASRWTSYTSHFYMTCQPFSGVQVHIGDIRGLNWPDLGIFRDERHRGF